MDLRQIDIQILNRQIERIDRQIGQIDRHIDRQIDISQIDRNILDRQIDRKIYRYKNRIQMDRCRAR